jgi:nitrous oxide reductase accessory protein NosL
MDRRQLLKLSFASGGLALAHTGHAAETCQNNSDGTPNQFAPKKPADSQPLVNELDKYPKCPYCGMNRKEHHATRMLVQYSDDLVDGVCSIHCLAISLSLNIDRDPKQILGPDFAATQLDPRPLRSVEQLTYLIGAELKHAMTKRSKHSFAEQSIAKEYQAKHGGSFGDFNEALKQTYLDMASDVAMIRKNRAERRRRAAEQTADHHHHG